MGMRGVSLPWIIWISGLESGWPPITARPCFLPPARAVSEVATEKPLDLVCSEWHAPQRERRIG